MTTEYLIPAQIDNRTFDKDKDAVRITPFKEWDSMSASKPDPVTEVYTFSKDGIVVETVTVTYEDSTKEFITNLVRA